MNQMQALLEKARSDKELMAKLNELGAGGAEPDKMPGKVVALAAEYGVTITEEDYRLAVEAAAGHVCPRSAGQSAAGCPSAESHGCARKAEELNEEDLEAVAGGATQNRYNPDVCGKYTKVEWECVGV